MKIIAEITVVDIHVKKIVEPVVHLVVVVVVKPLIKIKIMQLVPLH